MMRAATKLVGTRGPEITAKRGFRIVCALGGNALLKRGEALSSENQMKAVEHAAKAVARLLMTEIHNLDPCAKGQKDFPEVVLTHGNGPQVGLLALQSLAYKQVDTYPLDVLGAESEGMIGYLLEQQLTNHLPTSMPVATLLTQTLVDAADPAFACPSKFIGPVYRQEELAALRQAHPAWTLKPDGDYFRRVVASPDPRRILEMNTIRLLMQHKVAVICAGGGGVPVTKDLCGKYHGVEAVVDKDLTSALLADELQADCLVMLTDVDAVYENFQQPNQRRIPSMIAEDIELLEYPAGSMRPKLEAALRFVSGGYGKQRFAAIGSLESLVDLVKKRVGTTIESGLNTGQRSKE